MSHGDIDDDDNDNEEASILKLSRKTSSSLQIKSTPLHMTSKETQRSVSELHNLEPFMQAYGQTVTVQFREGPLGMQLADIGRRVLVTALERDEENDRPGQAEASGKIEVGFQIVAIASASCIGLSMRQVLDRLLAAEPPFSMSFQPIMIPTFPSSEKPSISDLLGSDKTLVPSGNLFSIEFDHTKLGVNVSGFVDQRGRRIVIVSQLLDDTIIGDGSLTLGSRVMSMTYREHGHEQFQDLSESSYVDVAKMIRTAPRPIVLTFEAMNVVPVTKTQTHKRRQRQKEKSTCRCTSCQKRVRKTSKYCWNCGEKLEITRSEESQSDLLQLDEILDNDAETPQVYSNFTGMESDIKVDTFHSANLQDPATLEEFDGLF